jgi:hypothetical protein
MSKNSINQTIEAQNSWRESLPHIKAERARQEAKKRKYDQKVKIKNLNS